MPLTVCGFFTAFSAIRYSSTRVAMADCFSASPEVVSPLFFNSQLMTETSSAVDESEAHARIAELNHVA